MCILSVQSHIMITSCTAEYTNEHIHKHGGIVAVAVCIVMMYADDSI